MSSKNDIATILFCIICIDRSRQLVCICSNILINVIGWVQCQHFHLSGSILILKSIIDFISIIFQFFCFMYFWSGLQLCSLVSNGFIGSREMETNEWFRCRKLKNRYKFEKERKKINKWWKIVVFYRC